MHFVSLLVYIPVVAKTSVTRNLESKRMAETIGTSPVVSSDRSVLTYFSRDFYYERQPPSCLFNLKGKVFAF